MATSIANDGDSVTPAGTGAAPTLFVARATVDAGSVITHYTRAGRGAPVLLLGETGVADGTGALLLPALAERFRVVAPEPAAGPEDGNGSGAAAGGIAFSGWLRAFLDGLGLTRVSLVAEERYGLPALGFALSDPERVDRLVLLFHDALDPVMATRMLPDNLRESGHPLLVLRLETGDGTPNGAAALAAGVAEFLAGAPASAEPA
jgi:pimeloyl-ACP methyl ester carboxylesterase